MKTYIKDDKKYDGWVCLCGNTPSDTGFYPINENNEEVEPLPSEWTTNQYYCASCGRVIDQDTLEVVRQVDLRAIVTLD